MTMRRQQILDAAIRVFADKGVHLASMRDICEESGLSMGAVYNHFTSKQELIFSYAEQAIEARRPISFETLKDLRRYLMDLLRDDTGTATSSASLDFQIFEEGLRDEVIRSIAARGAENAVNMFRDCLRELYELGEIRPGVDLDLSARRLAALLTGIGLFILLEVGPDKEAFIACVEDEFARMRVPDSS